MPPTTNMGLDLPTLDGDSGVWDDKINVAFMTVDAHDHTPGKGALVPITGLNINANLPMAGFGIDNIGKISFQAITAPVSGSKNLFVNTSDSELYWRSAGGVNVKITSGTTINTSLVGGIVGDYTSVGAEVAYDDANEQYTFKDESAPTKKWARLASGPVRLYQFNTTASSYVELASPSALAASYTVTWPAAVPGVQSLMQMSAAGVVSTGGAGIAHDVTLTANHSFNVSGTGKYKHDGRIIYLPCVPSLWNGGTISQTGGFPRSEVPISTTSYYPLMLNLATDAVINLVSIVADGAIGTGCTFSIYEGASGVFTSLSLSGTGTGALPFVTITSTNIVMSAHKPLWIKVVTDGATTVNVGHIVISYTV